MPLSDRASTSRMPAPAIRRLRRVVAATWALCAPLAGCEAPPIIWDEASPVVARAGDAAADSAHLSPSSAWRPETGDPSGAACSGSARFSRIAPGAPGGSRWYVAWWRVRPDGSARLMIARSDEGGSRWTTPVAVDTADGSRLGCARPPPAITADARGGYVHLAYFMNAPDGAGIFFAHSTDGGATFHTPVAVVYGDRPSAASVAASGDTVAVAYLDPNALRPYVALALSYTAGHVFERHALAVSGSGDVLEEPRVMLRGAVIDVSWIARPAAARAQGAPAMTIVRHGTLR